jgi:hypothetical protein
LLLEKFRLLSFDDFLEHDLFPFVQITRLPGLAVERNSRYFLPTTAAFALQGIDYRIKGSQNAPDGKNRDKSSTFHA